MPKFNPRKLSFTTLNKFIEEGKKFLKTDPTMNDVFDKYQVSIKELDYIPIYFDDLDVSAKTSKGVIILNFSLLEDGDFFEDYSYMVHEITHWLQQTTANKPTASSAGENYLDNKYEQESFQRQVQFIHDQIGEDEAHEYVDDLLEYHQVPKKEIPKKKEIFKKEIK